VFNRSFARADAQTTAITITKADIKAAYVFGKIQVSNLFDSSSP